MANRTGRTMPSVTMPYDRTTLHAEVDERYHARHSDAPYVLDPNDSSHQPWIDVWLEIRNEVLVEATNHWFFEQHPEAPPHLDPNDRAQADLVAEWIRIRDEILGTGVDLPPMPAATNDDPAAVEPSATEFDEAADRLRENIRTLLEVANLAADSEPARYVAEQLDTARSLYLGHHFEHHDEWTSPTATSTSESASTTSGSRSAPWAPATTSEWVSWVTGRPMSVAGRPTTALQPSNGTPMVVLTGLEPPPW